MKIKLLLFVALAVNLSVIAQNEELKQAPDNMSAETVFNNYIKAIGGKDVLIDVITVKFNADVTIEGLPMSLTAEIKLMEPNNESVEMYAEGMGVISRQKFDGEAGYIEQQGVKTNLTEEQINSKKGKHSIFPELYPGDSELFFEGITSLKGKDAYKVKVVHGENITYKYYDTESNLLVRAEMESKSQGKSTMEISDYKGVNEILFPYKQKIMAGMQVITMSYTNITINEGVTEEDFK
ncbi:LolA-like protein [Formosa maritima]|uniref:Outer membrane lipoprotein-sorting protein n=1 Tax=Formosa maritima TaxID=2592046 RepID=A0A5D0G4P2_9FLAO|nr:hypothetical protein [Formosa maritima]TYA52972.1 hypothetical protein FVF61_09915 [Formosa maritima]